MVVENVHCGPKGIRAQGSELTYSAKSFDLLPRKRGAAALVS